MFPKNRKFTQSIQVFEISLDAELGLLILLKVKANSASVFSIHVYIFYCYWNSNICPNCEPLLDIWAWNVNDHELDRSTDV